MNYRILHGILIIVMAGVDEVLVTPMITGVWVSIFGVGRNGMGDFRTMVGRSIRCTKKMVDGKNRRDDVFTHCLCCIPLVMLCKVPI